MHAFLVSNELGTNEESKDEEGEQGVGDLKRKQSRECQWVSTCNYNFHEFNR
jgi:hypothetical protein